MRTLTVRRGERSATARLERDERGQIVRVWRGDADLVDDCERAIARYRAEARRRGFVPIPPFRMPVGAVDRDALAHRVLCVVALLTYRPDVEVVDPYDVDRFDQVVF